MLEDIILERKKKLERLRESGRNAYPSKVKRAHMIGDVVAKFDSFAKAKKKIAVAGRVTGYRDQGGVIFLDIRDESGQIQGVANETFKNLSFFKSVIDRGDFVSIEGILFITKRGQKSIQINNAEIITKALRPVPADWYGLEETETRLRQRYLDLMLNPDVKAMFEKKTIFWESIRNFLKKEGFKEVETPVLEVLPGGAEAEPFQTHHNALDTDFYLRISLELPLKKLLVGGFEKVFEIGRVFRNEGIDKEHLQDYTQLEFYWAYKNYEDLMIAVEKMYKAAIKATCGGFITEYDGKKINWGKKWQKIEYVKIFEKETGIHPLNASLDELKNKALSLKLDVARAGRGRLLDLIYKKTVRPKLVEPCFLINPPVELEPLAKRSEKDPRLVERFQVVACGSEIGKGFSELNDPEDQRARFEEQMQLRAAGDKEAQHLDEDFLEALEYGMPPAAGFGTSERLFAILMNKPVRETVFFPLMRKKKE